MENSEATEIGEHIPCGYSMTTVCVFDHIAKILHIAEKIVWKCFVVLQGAWEKYNWFWKKCHR